MADTLAHGPRVDPVTLADEIKAALFRAGYHCSWDDEVYYHLALTLLQSSVLEIRFQ